MNVTGSLWVKKHYETLGLREGAGPDEIRRAARRLFMKYHPDLNSGDKSVFEEKTKEIIGAYRELMSFASGGGAPGAENPDSGNAPANAPLDIFVFELSGRTFCFEAAAVNEVLLVKDVRLEHAGLISEAFPYCAGVFYRGRDVALLLNLHEQLGLRADPISSALGRKMLIVITVDGSPAGFIADGISGIFPADPANFRPMIEDELRGNMISGGIIETDAGPAVFIDLRKLLNYSNF